MTLGGMELFSIDHVHIHTENVEDTVIFYKHVLGAKEIRRFNMKNTLFVHLELGGARLVISPSSESAPPGLNHYAISADDLDEAIKFLREKNVELTEPNAVSDFRNVFFRDPTGAVVEILSPSSGKDVVLEQ